MCPSCLGTGLVGLSRPQNAINTDLAARLAKAERERADIATEIVILRGQFNAQRRHDGALIAFFNAKVEDLTRLLEEAEAVIKPFAATAEHDISESETDDDMFRPMLAYNRAPRLTVGHLRAARKWLLPSPPSDN